MTKTEEQPRQQRRELNNRNNNAFHDKKIPSNRALVVDAGVLASKRHVVFGLVEADVTKALALRDSTKGSSSNVTTTAATTTATVPNPHVIDTINNNNSSNNNNNNNSSSSNNNITQSKNMQQPNKLSFTAFLVACLGRAIAEHPCVQAVRHGKKYIIFESVDVVTMIEPAKDQVAIPHIIRQADTRSVVDISQEIQDIQKRPMASQQANGRLVRLAPHLPRWIRLWAMKHIFMRDPQRQKELQGTAILTSIGMFGGNHNRAGAAFGVAFLPMHTLGITVGGIHTKPVYINDDDKEQGELQLRPRKFLCLTLGVDHDIVDGAAAARFINRFVELIESAHLMEEAMLLLETEATTSTPPAAPPPAAASSIISISISSDNINNNDG
jgi:pyruvate/2-oxoglutarate dehydrogenase complex dihydrolipoamide acyltransferase (E2) component